MTVLVQTAMQQSSSVRRLASIALGRGYLLLGVSWFLLVVCAPCCLGRRSRQCLLGCLGRIFLLVMLARAFGVIKSRRQIGLSLGMLYRMHRCGCYPCCRLLHRSLTLRVGRGGRLRTGRRGLLRLRLVGGAFCLCLSLGRLCGCQRRHA